MPTLCFRHTDEMKSVEMKCIQKVSFILSRPGIPGQSRFLSRVPGQEFCCPVERSKQDTFRILKHVIGDIHKTDIPKVTIQANGFILKLLDGSETERRS